MFKLAFCSANGTDLAILGKAVKSVSTMAKIEVLAQQNQNFNDPETLKAFIDYAKEADFLLISLHGGKEKSIGFQKILDAMPTGLKIHIHPAIPSDMMDAISFSTVDEESFEKIRQYLSYGGFKNYQNGLYYLLDQAGELKSQYEDPLQLPWQGIYHPEFDDVIDLKFYFKQKINPMYQTVGIWFHREHWSNGDTKYMDAFIREFESRQINVIPVFRKTRKDNSLGNEGLTEVLDHFFRMDGRPVVDVILNLMSFSSLMSTQNVSKDTALDEVLAEFGVPVIKGIIAFSSRENWNESEQGLSPIDVIANAALPEMDGNIMSLTGAFTDSSQKDPSTGASLVMHQPEINEIKAIVDRVINWARLQKLKNSEKKVAIIFHNYPPRNDTIGSAFGLDTKDSILNLLKLLKENGYSIPDMPLDGETLINELLAKTTNELRWLSEEKINHRATDVISESTYHMWFKKLTSKVQSEMCQYWDQPLGEFFTYQGQLAVPGMINGNIFLGIQPPRGNTLNPESVYHSPELPMPHCYYSYYEWIRNTFKADAVIHVGMHGTLEWLPGKALGLSENCYPRIAISDLPNLYIYIINNPGEGTQAKRRSNCCIVDHLIPVMSRADLYEETAELETQLQDAR